MLAIIRKELRSYFNSPIAYILVVSFLVFTGVWFFFVGQFLAKDYASLRGYFNIFPFVFAVIIPAVTMRSWAEEKKMGTDQILLTLPMSDLQLVLGKFFGAFILMAIMLALTLPVPIGLSVFGQFEAGQIVGEYLGSLFLIAASLSIGLFVSAVSTNQISAFIFSMLVLIVITMLDIITIFLGIPGILKDLLQNLSLNYHFESFKKGILDSRDLIYFVTTTVLFLYLNTKYLVFRKWR